MRPKDFVVMAILAWFLLRDRETTDVNIVITEPGFEGEEVQPYPMEY